MNAIMQTISGYWPVILAIGGAFAVAYATIRYKVPDMENRLRKIENMDFVTKDSCAAVQASCQKMLCAKIDILKVDLHNMDTQRQEARKEFHKELVIISKFMGRVEQFIESHVKRID